MEEKRGHVLVACPTYAGKEYALEPWLAAYRALTYGAKTAYQVDNTAVSQAYFERLRKAGIDCTHIQPWSDWDRTFRRCWELILKRATELKCYWVFSVEADNIPAPESLDVMVTTALYTNTHLIIHDYPMHSATPGEPVKFYYHELGCTLMTRALLQRTMDEYEEYGQMVMALFNTNERYHGGTCRLTNRFTVGHLDGYQMAIPNLGPSEIPGLFYPGDSMPANLGSELPPCLQEEQR